MSEVRIYFFAGHESWMLVIVSCKSVRLRAAREGTVPVYLYLYNT